MTKVIKFVSIFSLFVVLLLTFIFPVFACETGPVISKICVENGGSDTVVLVTWLGAPSDKLIGSIGQLKINYRDGEFIVPLNYISTAGTTSKWQGTVPNGHTGTLIITSGWVISWSNSIRNLPFSFVYGKSCSPTAVELKGMSAHSQSSSPLILFRWLNWNW